MIIDEEEKKVDAKSKKSKESKKRRDSHKSSGLLTDKSSSETPQSALEKLISEMSKTESSVKTPYSGENNLNL